MEYEVLSPWSEVDTSVLTGLTPGWTRWRARPSACMATFMALATKMLHVVEGGTDAPLSGHPLLPSPVRGGDQKLQRTRPSGRNLSNGSAEWMPF